MHKRVMWTQEPRHCPTCLFRTVFRRPQAGDVNKELQHYPTCLFRTVFRRPQAVMATLVLQHCPTCLFRAVFTRPQAGDVDTVFHIVQPASSELSSCPRGDVNTRFSTHPAVPKITRCREKQRLPVLANGGGELKFSRFKKAHSVVTWVKPTVPLVVSRL